MCVCCEFEDGFGFWFESGSECESRSRSGSGYGPGSVFVSLPLSSVSYQTLSPRSECVRARMDLPVEEDPGKRDPPTYLPLEKKGVQHRLTPQGNVT